ncbi:MAG: DUF2797 domain-containing protein [Candidatus Thorarchaeota archaeon]|jgi:hypothetical protein
MDGSRERAVTTNLSSYGLHIVNVLWRKIENGYESGFAHRSPKTDEIRFFGLEPGQKVSWTVLGPRMCVGFRNFDGTHVQCPERTALKSNQSKCALCSSLDQYDPCIRCKGHSCTATPEKREKCREAEYALYLAIFKDTTVKVGVSKLGRVLTRWLEQGVDYATVLVTMKDGKAVRRFEDSIGRRSDVAKSVQVSRKLKMLNQGLSLEEANKLLHDVIDGIDDERINTNIKLEDFSKFYGLSDLDTDPEIWNSRNSSPINQQFLGDIVGMKGSLLVTRFGHAFTVVNLKQLIGYTIDMDSPVEIMGQTGLRDFL